MESSASSLVSRIVRSMQLASLWLVTALLVVLAISHQLQFPTSYAFAGFLLAGLLLTPPIRSAISQHFPLTAGRTAFAVGLAILFGAGVAGNDATHRADMVAQTNGFASGSDMARAERHGLSNAAELTVYDKKVADKAAAAERLKLKQAAAAKRAELAMCKSSLSCWGDKYNIAASVACRRPVERLAKYQHEWTDSWVEPKFSHFKWKNKSRGQLVYFGDRIKFQNGFGAWRHYTYSCTYDPATKAVLNVGGRPGRIRLSSR